MVVVVVAILLVVSVWFSTPIAYSCQDFGQAQEA